MLAQWHFVLTLLTAHVAVGHVIGPARAADNQTPEPSQGNASTQSPAPVFFVENPAIHATVRFRSGEARLDSYAKWTIAILEQALVIGAIWAYCPLVVAQVPSANSGDA